MKKTLHQLILQAAEPLFSEHALAAPNFQIETTKDPRHGDYACNIALMSAKLLNMAPRAIAERIVQTLPTTSLLERVEIAGPGFINFTLSRQARYLVVQEILTQKEHFGESTRENQEKILLEFISSNPTGPLHVGHGRSAAFGSSLARLLRKAGYTVDCEYYVNDAGRQMEILAISVWLRYLALTSNQTFPFPANAYQGDYVHEVATALYAKAQNGYSLSIAAIFSDLPPDEADGGDKEVYMDALITKAQHLLGPESFEAIQTFACDAILEDIKNDLLEFGVTFENWFSEKSLFKNGAYSQSIADLKQSGYTEEKEGALWFKSTQFGDDKDRVVIRANGKPTYFAPDVAYHWNKYARGYENLIDIFGADHHGYVPRLKAVISALGENPDTLEILTVQFAILYRGTERVSMSTRAGSFITLRQLREEVGNDAARFFYIQRKSDQHMDFDLELAKSKSNENPVYYIQYAHARICSVFKQLKEKNYVFDASLGLNALDMLSLETELQLVRTLAFYPPLIENAAILREPHQIAHYLRELAHCFHTYYNACVFLIDDEKLRNARLCLIMATQQVLQNGLDILNISAPEYM